MNAVLESTATTSLLQLLGTTKPGDVRLGGVVDFFVPDDNLWIDSDLVACLKSCELVLNPELQYSRYQIIGDGNPIDHAVVASAPGNFVFEAGQLFPLLADMLAKQLRGEDGDLARYGQSNVFYMRLATGAVRVIIVARSYEFNKWHLNMREFDTQNNYPGDFVFFAE